MTVHKVPPDHETPTSEGFGITEGQYMTSDFVNVYNTKLDELGYDKKNIGVLKRHVNKYLLIALTEYLCSNY